MKDQDELRFLQAKEMFKETILFSRKDDWEPAIKKEIHNFVPFFCNLNEVDPDRFDFVIPLTIHSQKYINNHLKHLVGKKILAPSNNAIDICHDKEKFSKFLINNGFDRFVPKPDKNLRYPYILKQKTGAWGIGITIITDAKCEDVNIDKIASKDYFCQEYIEGKKEFTTHVIIHDKKIVFFKTIQFSYSQKFFVKGKDCDGRSSKIVNHSRHKDLFEKILNKIDYQGICCFNYKLHRGGVKIFEINPRYGGSMTRFLNEAIISYKNILNNA